MVGGLAKKLLVMKRCLSGNRKGADGLGERQLTESFTTSPTGWIETERAENGQGKEGHITGYGREDGIELKMLKYYN